VDLIPTSDLYEYAICDRHFMVVQLSNNLQKYTECKLIEGEDIRQCFPEIIGLESTCAGILSGKQHNFVLESIARERNSSSIIYFNLSVKSLGEYLVFFIEDITELMQLKQSLMQQLNESEIALNKLQRFEYCTNKIIASMRDVLLITTPSGKIERVNKSAIDLFGYKKSELLDNFIDEFIEDLDFDHLKIYSSLLASKDVVKKVDVTFFNKAQEKINIEFDCFLAPTEVKSFFNCVYIGRDITARKKAEVETKKALAREQELRQLKSGFISMASHEFRNPLSSILLCVQNLNNNGNLRSGDRDLYLQAIQDAALTMNSLLEDVLILSKAESAKQKLTVNLLNLKQFCLQIIKELNSVYADREVEFNYVIPQEEINLDPKNLRHILSNLLSNALKYSPSKETVSLTISCTSIEQPRDIIIEVCDRGIGIPQASQKHLFESFYRAANVDDVPGTGLGLSIVKKAVELYQGSIFIDSEVDRGTLITVKLPINSENID